MPRIVFLDEDQEYKTLIQNFIQEKGYEVYFAYTFSELEAVIEQKKPFVVIISEQQFVEDTVSMFTTLRKKFPTLFIVIRLHIETQLRRMAYFYIGADDVINKKLSFYELFYRLKRFNSPRYKDAKTYDKSRLKNTYIIKSYLIKENAIIEKETGRIVTYIGSTSKRVLSSFVDRMNTVVPLESLEGNSGSVKVILHRLNKLFERNDIKLRFKSIYGKGYVMKEV
jgi:DNA-binding response OmpR family regulator